MLALHIKKIRISRLMERKNNNNVPQSCDTVPVRYLFLRESYGSVKQDRNPEYLEGGIRNKSVKSASPHGTHLCHPN